MNNHIPCNQIRCSKSKNKIIKIVKNSCHICLQKKYSIPFLLYYAFYEIHLLCFDLVSCHTHTHKKHLIFARWRTHRQSAKIIKLQFDDETVQHTNVYTHSRSIMRLWTYARAARLVAINWEFMMSAQLLQYWHIIIVVGVIVVVSVVVCLTGLHDSITR